MALLIVLLLGIVARAIIAVGPGYLAAVSQGEDLREARRAAEAGLAYARARIKDNPAWRGDGNALVVDSPDLRVVEDNGNVFGLTRDLQGNVSTFRLRFNFQDGPNGGDALNDPAPGHAVESIYVSYNNSEGTGPVEVPRADARSFAVVAGAPVAYTIPAKSFTLAVEGRSGPGLRDLTDPAQPDGMGRVVKQTVETVFQFELSEQAQDAPIMGGSDLTFELPPANVDPGDRGGRQAHYNKEADNQSPNRSGAPRGWDPRTPAVSVTTRNGQAKPRLRSKKGVHVNQGTGPGRLQIQGGEIGREPTAGFAATVSAPVTEVDEAVGDGKDFYNLKWDDITRAESDPATKKAIQLPGGTYVHWADYSLHYYDMDFTSYQAMMADPARENDPGQVLQSGNLRELRTPQNLEGALGSGLNVRGSAWDIDKDLCIVPSAMGTCDFTILPRGGLKLTPNDDSTMVAGPRGGGRPDINVKNAILSVPGNTLLMGTLEGEGATFTAEGNMTVISREVRVGNGNGNGGDVAKIQGLNFYVKNDLTISSLQAGGSFDNIFIDGLVYCWGDFRGLAGGEGAPRWGEFDIDGALVAYGGDPTSSSPGSDGKGKISIAGGFIDLTWDGKNLASVVQLQRVPTTLRRTLYTVH